MSGDLIHDGRSDEGLIDEATMMAFLAQEWDRLHRDRRATRFADRAGPWLAAGIALSVLGVFAGAIADRPLLTLVSVGLAVVALLASSPELPRPRPRAHDDLPPTRG